MKGYRCSSGITEGELHNFADLMFSLEKGTEVNTEGLSKYGKSTEEIINYFESHFKTCQPCKEIVERAEMVMDTLKKISLKEAFPEYRGN